ncbi:glycosyl hydrolase family 15 [Paraburkholderia silvatlantica]|nr:glycosyl hydrolase family 15 [Paraburkholderia silvatlantica]
MRIVEGTHGSMDMHMIVQPRRADGPAARAAIDTSGAATVQAAGGPLMLRADVPLRVRAQALEAAFTVRPRERLVFTLCQGEGAGVDPASAVTALHDTQRHWRRWIGHFDNARTLWPQAVRRSLLTLHALVYRPTGAMIAAPTTSLPEAPGGELNWDYRYCWLRDASFALEALLEAGFHDEARAWRDWLLRTIGHARGRIHVMYCVDGSHVPNEREVGRFAGWQGARPVRFGNAACTQYQPDVFGEAFDCLYLTRRAGIVAAQEEAELEARLIGWRLDHGGKPGSGIWETRGRARHYTLSLRGDEDEAIAQFERVFAVANDVGLLAEEYDVRNGRLAGNFPQALSHLAVVKTAMLLSGSAQGHRRAR